MILQYKYPQYNIPSNLLEVTDEMLSQWEKEKNDCEEYNKNITIELGNIRERIISDAKNLWGEKSNVVKYLSKQRINRPSLTQLDYIKPRVIKSREDEKTRLYDIERRQKHFELCGKAIKFLTDRNKVINVDFNIDNAITIANDIAYEETISNKKKELAESGTFIEFIGDDNCEDCKGWNGGSHTCDCGNRRVSWSSRDGDDFFLDPYIYGEAY